jgi:hypothetical protein
MGMNDRLEIRYQDWYYDVTNFVLKHPGGNVIFFYTEKGEDATQGIIFCIHIISYIILFHETNFFDAKPFNNSIIDS